MPEDFVTKCKSCGADIIWIKYKDKAHPINAKPKKVFTTVEDEFGKILWWEYISGWESHFSSCHQSNTWRKKGKV